MKGVGKLHHIPKAHIGLILKAVSAAGQVCGVGCVLGIKGIQKPKGAVINGEAEDAHVVGVEYTVSEPNCLPCGHQPACALSNTSKPRCRHSTAQQSPHKAVWL